MPTYSFRCGVCGVLVSVVRPMGESGKPGPRCCGKVSVREFQVPRLSTDDYKRPIVKSFLNSMDGDVKKDAPPFSSRSEEKRYRAEHQAKFGWGGWE